MIASQLGYMPRDWSSVNVYSHIFRIYMQHIAQTMKKLYSDLIRKLYTQ